MATPIDALDSANKRALLLAGDEAVTSVFRVGPDAAYTTLLGAATARKAYGLVGPAILSGIAMVHTSAYNNRLFFVKTAGAYPGAIDLSLLAGLEVAYEFSTQVGIYRRGYVLWDSAYGTWGLLSEVPYRSQMGPVTLNFYKPKYASIELQPGYMQQVAVAQNLGDISFTVIHCPKHSAGLALTDTLISQAMLQFSGTAITLDGLQFGFASGAGQSNTIFALPLNISAVVEGQVTHLRNIKMRGGWNDAIYAPAHTGGLYIDDCDIIGGYDALRIGLPAECFINNSKLVGYQTAGHDVLQEISAIALGGTGTATPGVRSRIRINNSTLGAVIDSFARKPLIATDISFTAPSTIQTLGAVNFTTLVQVGELIRVATTSGTNNGSVTTPRTVASVTATTIVLVETNITTENAATAGTVRLYHASFELTNAQDNPAHVVDARNYLSADTIVTIDGCLLDISYDPNGGRTHAGARADAILVNNITSTSQSGATIVATNNKLAHVRSQEKATSECHFINNLNSGSGVVVLHANNVQTKGVAVAANVGSTAITAIA